MADNDLHAAPIQSAVRALLVLIIVLCGLIVWGEARGQSIFADGFETPVATNYCDDPMVQPVGWARATVAWEIAWSSPPGCTPARGCTPQQAVYPDGIGYPIPLGSNRLGYKVIPFTPQPGQAVNITWDVAQAYPGYTQPKPSAGMWLAISTCAGDLRLPSLQGDPYLRDGCRKFADKGGLTYSDLAPESSNTVCRVTPGLEHYLTVTPHWPEFGPSEDTCVLDQYPVCDVGAVHRRVQ